MSIESAILAALRTIDTLGNRIYPLEGLKNASPPFVLYIQDAADESDALDGGTGLLSVGYEIHCVAKNYAGLVGLSGSVRLALRGLQGTTHGTLRIERITCRQASPDLKDTNVNLYRRVYDLQSEYQEVNDHEI